MELIEFSLTANFRHRRRANTGKIGPGESQPRASGITISSTRPAEPSRRPLTLLDGHAPGLRSRSRRI